MYRFVSFRYILSKLGNEVYILLFNSRITFHPKISMDGWNINKTRGFTFLLSL